MFEEDEEKFELEMIPQTDNLFQGGSVEPTKSELRILKMRIVNAKNRLNDFYLYRLLNENYFLFTC